ncbi:MAG: nucleotidyltransferase domain-containing protein [Spirochaetes bacterium]|nr:nucleotidyltransferase domain-containing protein [Spirochaetota bacterium]
MENIHNQNILRYGGKIVEFLKSGLNLIAVYLYGSILNERFDNESDIDIAVITEDKTDYVKLYEMAADLSVLIKRDVHLVDFVSATDILRIEILKNKNVIFCSNDDKRLYYEMIALTSYQKLNEEREIAIRSKYGDNVWMSL